MRKMLLSVVIAAAAWGGVGSEPNRADAHPVVVLQDFLRQRRLPDGDIVALQVSRASSNQVVEFVLRTDPGIGWWKEIKVVDRRGRELGRRDLEPGMHRPTTPLIIPVRALDGARVIFSKAKFLGIHTEMYEMHGCSSQAGRRLTFTWRRD